MKKCLSFLFLVFFSSAMAGQVKVIKTEGEVKYRESFSSAWQDALPSTIVPEGGAIKTGINGMAVIDTGNKSRVWLRENTALEVEQKRDLITRLGLVFGKIKARIPHLMRREKYELRTVTAVCAVRGTELVMESDMEGRMSLQVLFGAVDFTYAIPPLRGERRFTLSQGEYINIKDKDKPTRPALMGKKMEMEGLINWDPGLKDEDRVKDIRRKEMDRAQLRNFAERTSRIENMVNNFTSKGRESDLEAGRTLRDIHGNLVRVDQRLVRPDPSTLQFLNLVKRPIYNYRGTDYSFKYNGGIIENRYDMAVFTMNFNQQLPQSISDWPSFFNKNDMNPEWATFVFANRSDEKNIFFTAEPYKYGYNESTKGWELINNEKAIGATLSNNKVKDRAVIISGILSGPKALSDVINFKLENDGSSINDYYEGRLKYKSGTTPNDTLDNVFWFSSVERCDTTKNCTNFYEKTGHGEDKLYQIKADLYAKGGNYNDTNNLVWFARENYIISNGGSIRGKSDFLNSGNDIFSLLKDSAGESLIYMKKFDSAQVPGGWADLTKDNVYSSISQNDYFSSSPGYNSKNSNIDIVIIPELALAGVQRVLPALDSLKD